MLRWIELKVISAAAMAGPSGAATWLVAWSLDTLGRLPGVGVLLLVARPQDEEHVAAVLAAVLDDERTVGQQWSLVGGDTDVARAIDELVAGRR